MKKIALAAAIAFTAGAAQARDIAPVTFNDQEAQVMISALTSFQRIIAALDPDQGLTLSAQYVAIIAKLKKAAVEQPTPSTAGSH